MLGDLDRKQEFDLLNFLDEITSINDLESLMEHIIQNVPAIFNIHRCSIYLTPEYVPQFNGELIDSDSTPIKASTIQNEFIVLAHTNYPDKQQYIGKIFYPAGEDLTGWVFKNGRVLNLPDSHDPTELHKVDTKLEPSVRYKSIEAESDIQNKFPVLFLPLRSDSKIIGVFKLHQSISLEGFTDLDEKLNKKISNIR
jgi:hypothetical protein